MSSQNQKLNDLLVTLDGHSLKNPKLNECCSRIHVWWTESDDDFRYGHVSFKTTTKSNVHDTRPHNTHCAVYVAAALLRCCCCCCLVLLFGVASRLAFCPILSPRNWLYSCLDHSVSPLYACIGPVSLSHWSALGVPNEQMCLCITSFSHLFWLFVWLVDSHKHQKKKKHSHIYVYVDSPIDRS